MIYCVQVPIVQVCHLFVEATTKEEALQKAQNGDYFEFVEIGEHAGIWKNAIIIENPKREP